MSDNVNNNIGSTDGSVQDGVVTDGTSAEGSEGLSSTLVADGAPVRSGPDATQFWYGEYVKQKATSAKLLGGLVATAVAAVVFAGFALVGFTASDSPARPDRSGFSGSDFKRPGPGMGGPDGMQQRGMMGRPDGMQGPGMQGPGGLQGEDRRGFDQQSPESGQYQQGPRPGSGFEDQDFDDRPGFREQNVE